jgi:asparagine synthase (glutamine-hydrolysing)
MCRIAGLINLPGDIQVMTDSQYRGGPDGSGIWEQNNVRLGHRRLSIIDLTDAGNQPMVDSENGRVIVFNGEIYNFLTLKEELLAKGAIFHSHTDTEVILKAFQYWGTDAFQRLRGMYAFAIYDQNTQEIWAARDPAGIKPFYYFHSVTKGFAFASEVRAFKSIWPDHPDNADWPVYLLAFGHIPAPNTILNQIFELGPGHYLNYNIQTGQLKKSSFHQYQFIPQYYSRNQIVEAIHEKVTAAVKSHLISDAPLGTFLSGGIDSSLLSILVKAAGIQNPSLLAVRFKETAFSEAPFQDLIAKKLQCHLETRTITKNDFYDDIEDILNAYDQPSVDGINTYFISKAAKEMGVKVMISGIGADELLGGYYNPNRFKTLLRLKKLPHSWLKYAEKIPDKRISRMSYFALNSSAGDYLAYRGIYSPGIIARILDMSENQVVQILSQPYALPEGPPPTDNELFTYLDFNYYLKNQLLKDTDVMSMWHGIEVRVPFLDQDLVQFCMGIDPHLRFDPLRPKKLLIDAFKDQLPIEIWQRPKQGFVFPFQIWLGKHYELINEHISLHSNPYVKNLIGSYLKGNLHWSRIWSLFLLKEISMR